MKEIAKYLEVHYATISRAINRVEERNGKKSKSNNERPDPTQRDKIYDAENRKEAVSLYKKWAKKWKSVAPKAVRYLTDDLEELLNVYYCPKEIRI